MKKVFALLLVLSCLTAGFLCSCADGGRGGNITKANLTKLVMADGHLIPGEGLEWGMSVADFLAGQYGSEVLDPESEKFEQHRMGTMPNGWTYYDPPVTVSLKDYGVTAEPDCTFDADGKLNAVVYTVNLPEDDSDQFVEVLNAMCKEADSAENLRLTLGEPKNFSADDAAGIKVVLQWADDADGTYFEINALNFSSNFVVAVRVSTVDLRADDAFE